MERVAIIIGDNRYTPIEFTGPAPLPGAACTDRLPEEKHQTSELTKCLSEEQRLKDAEHTAKVEECRAKGGFLNQLNATCSEALHSIEKGFGSLTSSASNLLTNKNDDASFLRLRKHFPDLANEKLMGDYSCKLCTSNGVLSGNLLITNNHCCFIIDQENANTVCVPLSEIVCLQRVCPAETDGIIPPHFKAVLNESEAKGIQLFLTTRQVLIFKEFLSIRNLPNTLVNEAFNVLDHMWRSAAVVPNADFKYSDAEHFVQPSCSVTAPIKLLKDTESPTSKTRCCGDASRAPPFQSKTESAGCSSHH